MSEKKNRPQIRYVDRPEVSEAFCDSLHSMSFDGRSWRIELCVTRMDEPNPPNPPTGCKYPSCRLVLTPDAGLELFNKLKGLVSMMQKSGALKQGPPIPEPPEDIQ